MSDLEMIPWLEHWYESLCDGDREHQYGVKIDTIDNPGWRVSIALNDSPFSNMADREVKNNISETDWYLCWIKNQTFEGAGDPEKLSAILRTFREWIEEA